MADQDFGDLVLIEQLLELTVRNGLDLGVDQPHVLDQHHAKEGRKDVPDGEVVLSLLWFLGRLRGFRPRRLVAVVAEARETAGSANRAPAPCPWSACRACRSPMRSADGSLSKMPSTPP